MSVVVLFEGTGAEENQHRFYRSRIASGVFGDWAVIWEWGRKSSSGMLRRLWFNNEVEAVVAAEGIAAQQTTAGGRPVWMRVAR